IETKTPVLRPWSPIEQHRFFWNRRCPALLNGPGLLLISEVRSDAFGGSHQIADGNRVDLFAQEGHVAVHEENVRPSSVEAEDLMVRRTVVVAVRGPGDPGAVGRSAEGEFVVVDGNKLRLGGTVRTIGKTGGAVRCGQERIAGHAVAVIRFSPSPKPSLAR